MISPVGSLLVLPLACAALALLAGFVLRQRESVLGYFGAGWLGNIVATAARGALGIDPWKAIGFADPLIWIFAGCVVVLLAARVIPGCRALPRSSVPAATTSEADTG